MRSVDGSIKPVPGRKGVLRVRVTVGYDPYTGKQVVVSRNVRGGQKAAIEVRDAIKRQYRTADAVVYGRMSVYTLVKEDIDGRELAQTTRVGYERTLENHIRPYFTDLRVADCRRNHIVSVLRAVEAPGARLNVYKLLRAAFRSAKANEWIVSDPMAGIDAPVVPEYQADTYTLAEMLEVLDFARGSEIEPGLIIAAWCGTRVSETVALNRQDLDLRCDMVDGEAVYSGRVSIAEGYVTVPGQRILKGTKTERSKREIALPALAVERLLEILGEHRIGPLMMDRTGQRMTSGGFSSRWRWLMLPRDDKDGARIYEPPVRYVELKNFRHSRITNLLELGQPLEWVSADAGHSIERTTEAIYNRRRRVANVATADALDHAARQSRLDRPSDSAGHSGA
jgi:integrase